MTELLIVSKPRGRIHKWIQGYKQYQDPIAAKGFIFTPLGDHYTGLSIHGGYSSAGYTVSPRIRRGQRFIPSITCKLQKVKLLLMRNGTNITGTAYVELWDDNAGLPGSLIKTLGTIDVSTLPTDQYATIEISVGDITLNAGTPYWIVIKFSGIYVSGTSYEAPYISASNVTTTDCYSAYTDDSAGSNWIQSSSYSLRIYVYCYEDAMSVDENNNELFVSFDFIYPSAGEKRLEVTFTSTSNLSDMELNGTSIGTSLAKEDTIPQADSYMLRFKTTSTEYAVDCMIQRWLYFSKTSITLDDLDVTEAYLQEIEFGVDGGTLRIDDDPANEIVGSSSEKIQFTDILVPFRKLEWVSGGGEVLILGVE